jgi:hypothetical protein
MFTVLPMVSAFLLMAGNAEVRVFLTPIIGVLHSLDVTVTTSVNLLAAQSFLLVPKVNSSSAISLTGKSVIFTC